MRILHFIDSLDYGGAETLLMSYMPLLTNAEHIVVTLNGPNVYPVANYEYIELNVSPVKGFVEAAFKLRNIITAKRIDIVHSHSYWTNIISRVATPKKVKLFNHYHFADYDTMKHKVSVQRMIFLDRFFNRGKLVRIAVSDYVAGILHKNFPKSKIEVIPNFIVCKPSANPLIQPLQKQLKIIAVGNCNLEKNYALVLQAFEELKEEPIHIDIYGGGDLLEFYQNEVKIKKLERVKFCGMEPGVREKMMDYHLFLSTSVSETFGMVVLEAACAGLPLMLSDIPAFREIVQESAVFFNPHNKADLIKKLKSRLEANANIDHAGYERIKRIYSPENFMFQLSKLYNN